MKSGDEVESDFREISSRFFRAQLEPILEKEVLPAAYQPTFLITHTTPTNCFSETFKFSVLTDLTKF